MFAVMIVIISPLFYYNYQPSFAQVLSSENLSFQAISTFSIQCPNGTTTAPWGRLRFSNRCCSSVGVQLLALWPNFSVSMCPECLNFDQHQIHLSTPALLFHNCTYFVPLGSELYSLEQLFWNPYFARSFMCSHDANVFKSQPRVRPRSLSEACQNQILVNEKRLASLSDAPCQPFFPRQRGSLSAPLGPTPDRQGSTRQPEGPPGQALQKQEISVQPRGSLVSNLMAFYSKQHATNTLQQDKGILTACRVHCGRDVSSMEQVCCWHLSAAFTYTQKRNKV